jgi:prephenate dehydratase
MTGQPRLTYLGPAGTFAEQALRTLDIAADAELVPAASVPAAIALVRSGAADAALIPIESSVEGSVPTTLDSLSTGEPLRIVDEVALPIRFVLAAKPGVSLSDVTLVAAHPHAEAQTRQWIAANVPAASVIPALSNADAPKSLADGSGSHNAAITNSLAASYYGLAVLADDIGDEDEATTRFVLVARPGDMPAPTGADRTSLMLFMRADHPGALLEILTEFAVRGVNLTRIESRPTRRALGDYFFSIDCEGHVSDARVSEALKGLHRICAQVVFLGSYPRHDGREAHVRPGTSDVDFDEASHWLAAIKKEISPEG